MLTRSFIKSYLLVTSDEMLDVVETGIKYINKHNCVRVHIPTDEQLKYINQQILELKTDQIESYQELLDGIFAELGVTDNSKREKLTTAVNNSSIDKFDKGLVKKFIETNLAFYS